MKHPIESDKRYTIEKEYCGHTKPRFVLRFAGEFVAQSPFYSSMLIRATGHRCERQGALVIEGVEA